jgi:hypothetical protein
MVQSGRIVLMVHSGRIVLMVHSGRMVLMVQCTPDNARGKHVAQHHEPTSPAKEQGGRRRARPVVGGCAWPRRVLGPRVGQTVQAHVRGNVGRAQLTNDLSARSSFSNSCLIASAFLFRKRSGTIPKMQPDPFRGCPTKPKVSSLHCLAF